MASNTVSSFSNLYIAYAIMPLCSIGMQEMMKQKVVRLERKTVFQKKDDRKNDGDCLRLMQILPRCVRVRSIGY